MLSREVLYCSKSSVMPAQPSSRSKDVIRGHNSRQSSRNISVTHLPSTVVGRGFSESCTGEAFEFITLRVSAFEIRIVGKHFFRRMKPNSLGA